MQYYRSQNSSRPYLNLPSGQLSHNVDVPLGLKSDPVTDPGSDDDDNELDGDGKGALLGQAGLDHLVVDDEDGGADEGDDHGGPVDRVELAEELNQNLEGEIRLQLEEGFCC